jgi:hypothetical protein
VSSSSGERYCIATVLCIANFSIFFKQLLCTYRNAGQPSQSTTVIYTVNSRPIVCENPFRKVFTRRQQFYRARERRPASPDASSKRLLWRPCDHACRRHSLCPDQRRPPTADDQHDGVASLPSPRFFTLNANIQPFAAFSIRHDLSGDHDLSSSSCSAVNLTLCADPDQNQPVEILPNGQVPVYTLNVYSHDGSIKGGVMCACMFISASVRRVS